MNYKICSKCSKELPATREYFYKSKGHKDKLHNQCKECQIEDGKKRNKKYEQHNRKYGISFKGDKLCCICGEVKSKTEFSKFLQSKDGLVHHCKKCEKNKRLLRNWNITITQYNKMFNKQNNKCAICGCLLKKDSSSHIDHNHKTGKVRGLLCIKCNSILGYAQDNVFILIKSVNYLKSGN